MTLMPVVKTSGLYLVAHGHGDDRRFALPHPGTDEPGRLGGGEPPGGRRRTSFPDPVPIDEFARQEETEWLWEGYLPRGALVIFSGHPLYGTRLRMALPAGLIGAGQVVGQGARGRGLG